VVLARTITSPADLHGMIASQGIITATGGSTSHAAVVARALGTCCVVGAAGIRVDERARTLTVGGRTLAEGDRVSLDGSTGELFAGVFTTSTPAATSTALSALLSAASAAADCEVYAEVSLAADVEVVRAAGAHGLLTSVHDVLAAAGQLDMVVDQLRRHVEADGSLSGSADLVAAAFGPILAAAGDSVVVVHGLDLLADRPGQSRGAADLVAEHPRLALPVGVEELLRAQIDGLSRARGGAFGGTVVFLAPRVSDPAEVAAVRAIAQTSDSPIGTGAVLAAPKALFHAEAIGPHRDQLWVDLHAVQSAALGVPTRILSAPEPLDGYLERGMLGLDPRVTIDPSVAVMLERFAATAWENDSPSSSGVRLTGAVSADVVAALHELGARRFAVEADEIRPFLLAVGRAAHS
jgi:pyruvate,orthophosphate dikinase